MSNDWMPGPQTEQLSLCRVWIGIMDTKTRTAWGIPTDRFTVPSTPVSICLCEDDKKMGYRLENDCMSDGSFHRLGVAGLRGGSNDLFVPRGFNTQEPAYAGEPWGG
jgi:hypothetical protein